MAPELTRLRFSACFRRRILQGNLIRLNRAEFRARKESVSGPYLDVFGRISAYLGTKMAQIRDILAVSEALGLGKQAQIRGDTPRYAQIRSRYGAFFSLRKVDFREFRAAVTGKESFLLVRSFSKNKIVNLPGIHKLQNPKP